MGVWEVFWGSCSPPTTPHRTCPHREQVLPKLHSDADYPCDLVGNWNTWYGEQDQAGENGQAKTSAHAGCHVGGAAG